ncbi:MAG: LemA family protein [Candidatus Margulisiibacteriota bacterium]
MWKWLVGILAFVLIMGMWMVGVYNDLVSKDQLVKQSWAQVETQLQRRFDLIPNLVNTVKGYAAHEKQTFENIALARSAWAGAKSTNEKVAAANQMEGALGRLMMVVENYPQLKAAENFMALQGELANTENWIASARSKYNEIVMIYNVKAKSIPTVFLVKMFGFDTEKLSFKAAEEAKTAPKVVF